MKYYTNKKVTKRFSKRFIRHIKKSVVNPRKKRSTTRTKNALKDEPRIISSPYNSNEYLMKNQSSPFYDDEDEEDFTFQQSELYDLVNGLKETKEIEFTCDKMDSTLDESEIINDAVDQCKKKIEENFNEIQKK
jgi:hypothetical protein